MTVQELIDELQKIDNKELKVYAEGEPCNKVSVECYKGVPQIVRIFKTWDVEFVQSPVADMEEENYTSISTGYAQFTAEDIRTCDNCKHKPVLETTDKASTYSACKVCGSKSMWESNNA